MSLDAPGSPWGEIQLGIGECRYWRIGPLGFWIRRQENEWNIAEERYSDEGTAVAESVPAPSDTAWTRWASGPERSRIRISPATPDRPIVARPAQPFRIVRNGNAQIYISIPISIRIELSTDNDPILLTEIPTIILSNTWFGSVFEGQLCYWTETSVRRQCLSSSPLRTHIAVASMYIDNGAQQELPLEKICLHTDALSLYDSNGQLWTSEIRVKNRGLGSPEELEVKDAPPSAAENAILVAMARTKSKVNILSRTFELIGQLPGLGG